MYDLPMSSPVSVLIPTYNRADLLPETLDSILSQSRPPAEVIVVDDGSKDNTREVAERFGTHIRYHYQSNGGVCRARNTAASLASGDFFAFCDSDDLWRSDKLAQQMELHDRHPGLTYSFTNFIYFSDLDKERSQNTKFDDAPNGFFGASLPPGDAPLVCEHPLYDQLLAFQPVWPSTIVIARKRFEQMNGFREHLGKTLSEDFEFTLRCVQDAPIGVIRQPLVQVRRHALNFSADTERTTRGEIEILRYVLEHHAISASTRALVEKQIHLRRVEVSYGAFRRGDFQEVVALCGDVPSEYLDTKSRLKLGIARLPPPIARVAQRLLLHG